MARERFPRHKATGAKERFSRHEAIGATDRHPRYEANETTFFKEIRPGRTLLCREIVVRPIRSMASVGNNQNEQIADILFIHGSCAASSQYDTLIESISNLLNDFLFTSDEVRIDFHLFDSLGCGRSTHPPHDWDAFSENALARDLESVASSVLDGSTNNVFIIAHSYGTSQVIKLINSLDAKKSAKIKGVIFLSGGLKDGPAPLTKDGGHWIWHYVPMCLLRFMQPLLNKMFLDSAIHPSSQERLRESAQKICNSNDMAMCKAFYRQQRYATSEDARKVINKALVIHGENDKIIPLCGGVHLHTSIPNSEFYVIKEASHQVFEEHPKQVAELILKFIR